MTKLAGPVVLVSASGKKTGLVRLFRGDRGIARGDLRA